MRSKIRVISSDAAPVARVVGGVVTAIPKDAAAREGNPALSAEVIVYDGASDGPRVLIRERGSYASIVIEDGKGRYLSISPAYAAQVASGLDAAIARIGRDGRVRRST